MGNTLRQQGVLSVVGAWASVRLLSVCLSYFITENNSGKACIEAAIDLSKVYTNPALPSTSLERVHQLKIRFYLFTLLGQIHITLVEPCSRAWVCLTVTEEVLGGPGIGRKSTSS